MEIDFTPIIQYVLPVVLLVLTGVAVWLGSAAINYFQAKTGVTLGADARGLINDAIQRGIKFAEAQINEQVSRLDPKVTVSHPIVAQASNYVIQAVPDALVKAGVTQEALAQKILAELPAVPSQTDPLKVEVKS